MHRVTIATAKLEESIRFYTDVLGAHISYDHSITPQPEPGAVSLLGPEGNTPHRLVSLQQGDIPVGMLGLLEYQDANIIVPSLEKKPGMPHPMVLVIRVDDVEQVATRARELGLPIIRGPAFQAARGKGAAGNTLVIVDPNGVVLELSQPPIWDPEHPRPTSPILRATVAVARESIEPSIKFYQQVLGMSVMMDREITFAPGQFPLGDPGQVTVRLVVMQQGDSQMGNIGLMTYLEPEMEIRPFIKQPGSPYPVIFVFLVDDLDEVLARAQSLGSPLIARMTYEIPQRGQSEGATIIDPNGVVIDLH